LHKSKLRSNLDSCNTRNLLLHNSHNKLGLSMRNNNINYSSSNSLISNATNNILPYTSNSNIQTSNISTKHNVHNNISTINNSSPNNTLINNTNTIVNNNQIKSGIINSNNSNNNRKSILSQFISSISAEFNLFKPYKKQELIQILRNNNYTKSELRNKYKLKFSNSAYSNSITKPKNSTPSNRILKGSITVPAFMLANSQVSSHKTTKINGNTVSIYHFMSTQEELYEKYCMQHSDEALSFSTFRRRIPSYFKPGCKRTDMCEYCVLGKTLNHRIAMNEQALNISP